MLNFQCWIFNVEFSMLNFQCWIFNVEFSMLNFQKLKKTQKLSYNWFFSKFYYHKLPFIPKTIVDCLWFILRFLLRNFSNKQPAIFRTFSNKPVIFRTIHTLVASPVFTPIFLVVFGLPIVLPPPHLLWC
jgi:hypothetical protein